MKTLAALALATALTNVHGHPSGHHGKGASLERRGADISSIRMPDVGNYSPSHETVNNKVASSIQARREYTETATEFVKKQSPKATFRMVDDHYVGSNGIAHVRFKQTHFGLDVDNADFNVNIGKDGKIFSFGNNFFSGDLPAQNPLTKRDLFGNPEDALKGIVRALGLDIDAKGAEPDSTSADNQNVIFKKTTGALADPSAKLAYFNKGKELALTWRVETSTSKNWLLSYVDAKKHDKLYGAVDYISDLAAYEVFPWDVADPSEGERKVLEDPWDIESSPFTWQGLGDRNTTSLSGNNGGAQGLRIIRPINFQRKFEYNYSPKLEPLLYQPFSATQLFYTANKYHDLLYTLGFTEAAGNFQSNNNGKGGKGGDPVTLNTQDPGLNNANFATPPDGQAPTMNMYMFTKSSPFRDSSLDQGVVVHEYTHGLSTRLTGGPDNSGCLSGGESGGMGEGWGDFMATAIALKKTATRNDDVKFGHWIVNSEGIRKYPYSTKKSVNPLLYSNIGAEAEVHNVGTIWANMLFEVIWNLIDKHGITSSDKPEFDNNGAPKDGRYLTMKLVIDGMALQPCSPNFIQARDAIIDADKALTGGANRCDLWKGFATRGLGSDAVFKAGTPDKGGLSIPIIGTIIIPPSGGTPDTHTDGFAIPSDC